MYHIRDIFTNRNSQVTLLTRTNYFNATLVIYYTKDTSIRRLTADGKNDTEIYNAIDPNSRATVGDNIYIAGEYIVFRGFHDDNSIYKIKNDGTGLMVYKQGWVK